MEKRKRIRFWGQAFVGAFTGVILAAYSVNKKPNYFYMKQGDVNSL